MSTFRTSFQIKPSSKRISLSDRILTIGSCFSDAIGSQFIDNKINCNANPYGVIYNPASIHKVLQYSIFNQSVPDDTFLNRDDVFFNYDFHSEFSSMNLSHLQAQIKTIIVKTHSFLRGTHWLIITYGTAWVYERIETNSIVANCHKMPQTMFTKSLMTQKKVIDSFDSMYQAIKSVNPDMNILLTVSPVRHLKDTLELNSVSKSVLRVACHTITEQYRGVYYFPAYEIMMDDLRDYRFYKADMIHPAQVAEQYIWQKFAERYFDDELIAFLRKWEEIQSALAHKPFHPGSSAHQRFVREMLKKLDELKSVVNVDEEVALLRKQLEV
jgi:hypothetical protein